MAHFAGVLRSSDLAKSHGDEEFRIWPIGMMFSFFVPTTLRARFWPKRLLNHKNGGRFKAYSGGNQPAKALGRVVLQCFQKRDQILFLVRGQV
jgi:hypothetical protein